MQQDFFPEVQSAGGSVDGGGVGRGSGIRMSMSVMKASSLPSSYRMAEVVGGHRVAGAVACA